MARQLLLTLLSFLLMTTLAFAQGGVFEDLTLGDAKINASSSGVYVKPFAVRLNAVCEVDSEDSPLRNAVEQQLKRTGIAIDSKAALVLRFESSPCAANVQSNRRQLLDDALRGTSRAYELPPPARQFEVPLGKRNSTGTRLTLNLLLYKPGQAPIWNALVAARAPGPFDPEYFAQMANVVLPLVGQSSDARFELTRVETQ